MDEENSLDNYFVIVDEDLLLDYYKEKAKQYIEPINKYDYTIRMIRNGNSKSPYLMTREDINNIGIGDKVFFNYKDGNNIYVGIKISDSEFVTGHNNEPISFDEDLDFLEIEEKKHKFSRPSYNMENLVLPANRKVYKTRFIGEAEIIQSGLIYLTYKHDEGCSSTENGDMMVMLYRQGDISVDLSFMRKIKECLASDKRFVFWNLDIMSADGVKAHANLMFYDKNNKSLERFDPHGYSSTVWIQDPRIDKKIIEFLSNEVSIMDIYSYIKPQEICPVGPQNLEKIGDVIVTDPGGFCAAWSLWYADLRLSNPDISPSDIIYFAVQNIRDRISEDDNNSFTSFIRNYSEFIYKFYNFLQRDNISSLKIKRLAKGQDFFNVNIDDFNILEKGPVNKDNYVCSENTHDIEDLMDNVLLLVNINGEYYECVREGDLLYIMKDELQGLYLEDLTNEVFCLVEGK